MPPTLNEPAKKQDVKLPTSKHDAPIETSPEPELAKAINLQFINTAEEYLSSKGWKKVNVDWRGQGIWQDHVGDLKTTYTETTVVLPSREKGTEIIKQKVGSPVSWNYSAEEAVHIQRTRDEYAEKLAKKSKVDKVVA